MEADPYGDDPDIAYVDSAVFVHSTDAVAARGILESGWLKVAGGPDINRKDRGQVHACPYMYGDARRQRGNCKAECPIDLVFNLKDVYDYLREGGRPASGASSRRDESSAIILKMSSQGSFLCASDVPIRLCTLIIDQKRDQILYSRYGTLDPLL